MDDMRHHNNPPDPLDEALAPYGEAIELAEGMLTGDPVSTEAQMKAVDAALKEVKAAEKAVKGAEESAAKPLYDVWKAEKARWAPTIDDLGRIKKGLAAMVSDFKKKLAAEKEAERRAALAEAERKRREAEALAANTSDLDAQREAAALAQQAKEDKMAARQAEKVKGLRTVTKYEISDHRALLHWIAANDRDAVTAFIDEYARRNHSIDRPMDGLRVWQDKEAF